MIFGDYKNYPKSYYKLSISQKKFTSLVLLILIFITFLDIFFLEGDLSSSETENTLSKIENVQIDSSRNKTNEILIDYKPLSTDNSLNKDNKLSTDNSLNKDNKLSTDNSNNNDKNVGTDTNDISQNNNISNNENTFLVTRVIDGDTIRLENGDTIRLIGIDTPETVNPNSDIECFGIEASDKTKEILEGKYITLQKDISETDRYGRLLRYVYLDDIFVNDYLVKNGFATVSTYPPDVKYVDLFTRSEQYAAANNLGLWSECDY